RGVGREVSRYVLTCGPISPVSKNRRTRSARVRKRTHSTGEGRQRSEDEPGNGRDRAERKDDARP
ncbi:unnamed protein product, partial [Ectocarpus sp. 13 AM-2016]